MQPAGEAGGGVGGPGIQPVCDAERGEAVPVELPEVVPGLGGKGRSDHDARRAAAEAPRHRLQHDAPGEAQVPLPGGHSARHASEHLRVSGQSSHHPPRCLQKGKFNCSMRTLIPLGHEHS